MIDDKLTSFEDVSGWLEAHERLANLEAFSTLGRFHGLIDAADVKFWNLVREERPGLGHFKTLELTTFGREVGGDSPRWWVFSKEPDIVTLWNDTKITFLAAQTLLRAAEQVDRQLFETYDELIDGLCRFVQEHRREIHALLNYAQQLAKKSELAPAILFSYSVWGSTRRSDRSLDRTASSASTRVRLAGELALGLRSRTWPASYHAWLEAIDDAYGAASPEDYVSISARELFRRTEHGVKRALSEYFAEVRDSIRHIDLLCQEAHQREHLYADDSFLTNLLAKVAVPGVVETDLWDVKETLDMWHCPEQKRKAAAVTFAEDVAAFANTRGGVLLIGVTNTRRTIAGVADAENRIKHMESILRSRLDCAADFLRIRSVELSGLTCIVVVIGQTAEPVGVLQVNDSYTYPIRVGPGIERISRSAVFSKKPHMKGTSFAFAAELASWVG